MSPAGGLLSALEREDIAAVALALPEGWIVQLEPPHGQMAITPRVGAPQYVACWSADRESRRMTRHRLRPR